MPSSTDKTQTILIAGAGPVGLTAAIELKRRGFTPRIIDSAIGPAGESRALGIHARTLDIFGPSNIAAKFLAAGNKVDHVVIRDEDDDYLSVDFSLTRQQYNFALILPQSKTELILLAHLRNLGIDVEWETELTGFNDNGTQVECHISKSNVKEVSQTVLSSSEAKNPDDQSNRPNFEIPNYDFLIGCDGAHSVVRKTIGVGFEGAAYEHDWHLADVRFSSEQPTNGLRVKTIGSNVLAHFPISSTVGRFVFSGENLLDEIEKEVKIQEVIWESKFRISHRIVESYQRGNVFLAGDAAHIHSPVGGRGMNLGIEDAATLAWLIETGNTDRYTQMRLPIGRSVLRFTDRQTRLMTSKNWFVRFLRRNLAPVLLKSQTLQRMAFRQLSGANTPAPEWLP